MFFVVVSPMFLIHHVALLSRSLPEKFSSSQVRFWEETCGRKLLFFWLLCPVGVFCCSFAYVVDSLCGIALPTTPRKILFLSGSLFGINFRERTFVFCLCVRLVFLVVVFPMFLLYYVALCS